MYSLLVSRLQAKITAKGIKKSFVKKHVKHDMFLHTLKNKSFTTAKFLFFRSRNHTIHTQRNVEKFACRTTTSVTYLVTA